MLMAASLPLPLQERFPHDLIFQLQKVVEQDPLAQLDEQDKELIWRMRSEAVASYYRMADNFRGIRFSRMLSKQIFAG